MSNLLTFRKEVRDYLSAHERLQSIMAQGTRLTDDEAGTVTLCANELLVKLNSVLRRQDLEGASESKTAAVPTDP